MFRFEEPEFLYLLILLPFLAALLFVLQLSPPENIRKFGEPAIAERAHADISKYRPDMKFWLIFAAVGLLYGTAGPSTVWLQDGDGETQGVEV